MTVKNITLLSMEEYKRYRPIVPDIDSYWWLRSSGELLDTATFVFYNGNIGEFGYYVLSDNIAVRPALLINLEITDNRFWYKPEKLIGTKIKYGNYKWTILDASFGELYVLCDDTIAIRRFDSWSNNWDKSELKRWLETEGMKIITL